MPGAARRSAHALGARGELAVARWYEAAGYRVLARNWSCAGGELDLVVAAPGHRIVIFCEVKTRSSARHGSPFEAVTPAKRRRIRQLAALWLAQQPPGAPRYGEVRFDVAAVRTRPGGSLEIEVAEAAL